MPPPNTPQDTPRNLSRDLGHLTVPPNTPIRPASPRATRRAVVLRPAQLAQDGTVCGEPTAVEVDFRALTYAGPVDENLICPICRVALVDPVDTVCDHTFCRDCITEALCHNNQCPVDRYPLSEPELYRSHKIVLNQLDALQVHCICCRSTLPRSMLENHLERYCKDALVKCPGKTCRDLVKRKYFERGCLHHDATCPDCDEVHQEIDMETHRELNCKVREAECKYCGAEILRCKEAEHLKECPDVVACCKWAVYGCQHESKRKELDSHAPDCNFKIVGPMAEILKSEIAALRDEVHALNEKDRIQERRIKFLENRPITESPLTYSEISNQTVASLPAVASSEGLESRDQYDSSDQYLLSLIESQESRVDQISAGMTDLEAKQTMMLFNETIPIKEQLAELRSEQGLLRMHVRWLVNFKLQERRPGPGPSAGSESPAGPGNSSQPPPQPHRRLSDSTRDIVTKL
ncbi:hypothetical protein B7463_g4944, partial [Scytalidium lignicola]